MPQTGRPVDKPGSRHRRAYDGGMRRRPSVAAALVSGQEERFPEVAAAFSGATPEQVRRVLISARPDPVATRYGHLDPDRRARKVWQARLPGQ
jgi:hypothetical protein